jgi:cell wall-associated NlpC family hydrolase
VNRQAFLSPLIGLPWRRNAAGPDAFDCWGLVTAVERDLFKRELPSIAMPDNASWRLLIETFDGHPERKLWREAPADAMGLITASDGAIVLMSRLTRPAHAGVWLRPEKAILHADDRQGVSLEKPALLKAKGWTRLRFYEPAA